MATIWLTYAWEDNNNNDIDFVAQELIHSGVDVKLDRWNIQSGKRLWEQIDNFIQNPAECDAWVIYATPNSLGSQPCQEEFAYALDRALNSRGQDFPIIGLLLASVDHALIPAGIRIRLHVSLKDPNWKERIKAAAEGYAPAISRPYVEPYYVKIHSDPDPSRKYAIELRPRAGTWSPFMMGIPILEKDKTNPSILHGPAGTPPEGGILHWTRSGESTDGQWWTEGARDEATPTQSYYVYCDELPSRLIFGKVNEPQYFVEFGLKNK